MAFKKPKILCVDDDASILREYRLHLRRKFDVHVAQSGADGLKLLRQHRSMAVIVSDMRMPNMDGAEFLSRAKDLVPQAVRVLLTGYADFDTAINAVNEGQIFRFLAKPCPPEQLQTTLEACVEQHRLLRSEKELLNQTLVGCVKVMRDVVGFAGLGQQNSDSLSSTLLEELRPGMILAEDLRATDGMLLVLEGSEVDQVAIEHVVAHRQVLAAQALRVIH